jgi:hypothetical protein
MSIVPSEAVRYPASAEGEVVAKQIHRLPSGGAEILFQRPRCWFGNRADHRRLGEEVVFVVDWSFVSRAMVFGG